MNKVSRKSRGRRKRRSKASRRRSRVSKTRSRCNSRRLKRSCNRRSRGKKRCSWVKRKSSGRRKHKGYCKKGGSGRPLPPLPPPPPPPPPASARGNKLVNSLIFAKAMGTVPSQPQQSHHGIKPYLCLKHLKVGDGAAALYRLSTNGDFERADDGWNDNRYIIEGWVPPRGTDHWDMADNVSKIYIWVTDEVSQINTTKTSHSVPPNRVPDFLIMKSGSGTLKRLGGTGINVHEEIFNICEKVATSVTLLIALPPS